MQTEDLDYKEGQEYEEDVVRLSKDYGLDLDEAEKVQELINTEGLDEEEAIELNELM